MEAYIDEELPVNEEEEEDEDDTPISVADIYFNRKSLEEYELEFTRKLPAIPCSGQEILAAISEIANAYQLAYNSSARLTVVCAKAEKDYKIKRNELIHAKISSIRALNPGKSVKLPSRETIESMVFDESQELGNLVSEFKKWSMVKEWFDAHVRKLTQMLSSAKDISYAVNNRDRMFDRGNV